MGKRIFIVFLAAVLLSGCHQSQEETRVSVATRIGVTVENHGKLTRRTYTQEEKMRPVLNALRTLGHRFAPSVDPGSLRLQTVCITVLRSDGSRQLYCIKGCAFIREGRGPWQQTDPKRLRNLTDLLRRLPGDGADDGPRQDIPRYLTFPRESATIVAAFRREDHYAEYHRDHRFFCPGAGCLRPADGGSASEPL